MRELTRPEKRKIDRAIQKLKKRNIKAIGFNREKIYTEIQKDILELKRLKRTKIKEKDSESN